jgi:hypothetical protein
MVRYNYLPPLNSDMSLYQRGFCNSPLNWKMRFTLNLDILQFLRSVQSFPLSWRKLSLAVCRVQVSPSRNRRLEDMVRHISDTDITAIIIPATSTFYHLEDLIRSLDVISTSPYLCSLCSYVVRAERFSEPDVRHIRSEGILKEVLASLQTDNPQVLWVLYHYRCNQANRAICRNSGRDL